MKIRFAVLACLTLAVLHAAEVPGTQPVPPSQLQGSVLLLPQLPSGSVSAPGPTWEWRGMVQQPSAYMLYEEATDRRFMLMSIDAPYERNEKNLEDFWKGMRRGLENSGMTVIAEKPLSPLTFPLHGEVHRFQYELQGNGQRLFTTVHLLAIGKTGLVLSSYTPDGKEPAETQMILNSLKYTPQPKPVSKDTAIMAKVVGYFMIGGIVWVIGLVVNTFARRQLVNGALLGVFFILLPALGLSVLTGMNSNSYAAGQEIGAAFWPVLLFGYLASRKKKENSPEIPKS